MLLYYSPLQAWIVFGLNPYGNYWLRNCSYVELLSGNHIAPASFNGAGA